MYMSGQMYKINGKPYAGAANLFRWPRPGAPGGTDYKIVYKGSGRACKIYYICKWIKNDRNN